MANPTTNYGWPMPTSTDLVTDLPADFALFGQPVDTSLKALNPETTLGDIAYRSSTSNTNTRLGIGTNGQVLAVSSGVPAWTTTADVTPLTTKGDVFTFSTVDARIGVGANNTVLTADSAEATGLKWATPASGSTYIGASISMSANQSIPNTTDTKLSWDTEQWDTTAIHAAGSPTRMTVPTGYNGKWRVSGQIITASGSGGVEISIYVNGTRYVAGTPNFGSPQLGSSRGCDVAMNLELNLSVADYVELECWQNSGGSLNVFTASRFQFSYIGA